MTNQLHMTAEEADRLGKLIKDPEFMKIFGEYAKEVQDPAVSAEMNEYLKQLEAEGQAESVYGSGVQLIIPEPSFVIKTKDVTGANRVYINICASPKVGEMQQEARQGPSGNGVFVTIPMVLHAKEAKKGTTPDGAPVLIWDIAVNPNATAQAAGRRGVLDTLVMSALERIEQVSSIKLLREYKLPKLKYKGVPGAEQPGVMAARTGEGGEAVDGRLRPISEAQAAAAVPETMPHCSTTTESSNKRNRSSFSFDSKTRAGATKLLQQSRQQETPPIACEPWVAGYRHACGAITPSWRLTERIQADLGDAWADAGRGLKAASNIPQALVIKVDLPGVESAAALQLDVGSDAVLLQLHGKYMLDLTTAQLKYKLLPDQGAAKFDKAKQQLTLILQVAPLQGRQQQQQHVPGASTTPKHQEQPGQHKQRQQDMHAVHTQPEQQAQSLHQHPQHVTAVQLQAAACSAEVSCGTNSSTAGAALGDAVAVVSRSVPPVQQPAVVTSKTSNQLLWEQVHGSLDRQRLHQKQLQLGTAAPAKDSTLHDKSPQQQQTPQLHDTTRAPLLKPRLMSRQLNAADLD